MGVNEIFNNLCNHHENEVVEFKKAENNFDFDDLVVRFRRINKRFFQINK